MDGSGFAPRLPHELEKKSFKVTGLGYLGAWFDVDDFPSSPKA